MLRRSYKFRVYPSKAQVVRLVRWLDLCRNLYNCALEQRRNAWTARHISLSGYDQMNEMPALKSEIPEYKILNAQVAQNVLARLDETFAAFFRRLKTKETPGFPRFKSYNRFNSFTHPQASRVKFETKKLYMPSFGWLRWKPWKSIESVGRPKTVMIKREADGWYAIVVCEVESNLLPQTGRSVGIDIGLINPVTTSEGEFMGDLRPLKAAEAQLRQARREVTRKQEGSNRRKAAAEILARRSQDLARSRKAQLDIISRRLVNGYDLIAVEDLNLIDLMNMGSSNAQGRGMRRNWRHVAPSMLFQMLAYKAESAGREFIKVDPRGTSIECSGDGTEVRKSLSQRRHICPTCGLDIDRDHNAALNILKRGLQLRRGDRTSVVEAQSLQANA